MSVYARNFLRLRSWLENLDGGELHSLNEYQQRIADNVRGMAGYLVQS